MKVILMLFFFMEVFADKRASSAPFVSGDTFRFHCDWVYDELDRSLSPKEVKCGDSLFVKTDYLPQFFANVHPYIREPYILVTHNSDHPAGNEYTHFLDDDKIIAWFGQNTEGTPHPKLHAIPIGIANRCWTHGNIAVFERMMHVQVPRDIFLYMNFEPGTYPPERGPVADLFKNQPYCYVAGRKPLKNYLSDLCRSVFVLSPRGNGVDCHRTWEALLMGAIPIVKSSTIDPLFEGLPVVIVNDWHEVNLEFLQEKEKEMHLKSHQLDRVKSDYWLHLIDSYKKVL